jgi:hypothetical protein
MLGNAQVPKRVGHRQLVAGLDSDLAGPFDPLVRAHRAACPNPYAASNVGAGQSRAGRTRTTTGETIVQLQPGRPRQILPPAAVGAADRCARCLSLPSGVSPGQGLLRG